MTYIDNSKRELYQKIYILELENELLRAKLKALQNDKLLDNTEPKDEPEINETNDRIW